MAEEPAAETEETEETEETPETPKTDDKKINIPLSDGTFAPVTPEELQQLATVGANVLNEQYKNKNKNKDKDKDKDKVKEEKSPLEKRLEFLEQERAIDKRKNEDSKIITAIHNTIKSDPDLEDWADEVVASVIGKVAMKRQETGSADLKEILAEQMTKYKLKVGKKGVKVNPENKEKTKKETGLTTAGGSAGEISGKKSLGRKSFRGGELARKVLESYKDLISDEKE
jgi:hypothetical protein